MQIASYDIYDSNNNNKNNNNNNKNNHSLSTIAFSNKNYNNNNNNNKNDKINNKSMSANENIYQVQVENVDERGQTKDYKNNYFLENRFYSNHLISGYFSNQHSNAVATKHCPVVITTSFNGRVIFYLESLLGFKGYGFLKVESILKSEKSGAKKLVNENVIEINHVSDDNSFGGGGGGGSVGGVGGGSGSGSESGGSGSESGSGGGNSGSVSYKFDTFMDDKTVKRMERRNDVNYENIYISYNLSSSLSGLNKQGKNNNNNKNKNNNINNNNYYYNTTTTNNNNNNNNIHHHKNMKNTNCISLFTISDSYSKNTYSLCIKNDKLKNQIIRNFNFVKKNIEINDENNKNNNGNNRNNNDNKVIKASSNLTTITNRSEYKKVHGITGKNNSNNKKINNNNNNINKTNKNNNNNNNKSNNNSIILYTSRLNDSVIFYFMHETPQNSQTTVLLKYQGESRRV